MSASSAAEPLLYFETSALIKLLLAESGSKPALEIWRGSGRRIGSQLTYAEGRAALTRARRGGRLKASGYSRSVERFERLFGALWQIPLAPALIQRAGELAGRHALRGYDAVHLAAALAGGRRVILASWDRELRAAASSCGLAVAPAL